MEIEVALYSPSLIEYGLPEDFYHKTKNKSFLEIRTEVLPKIFHDAEEGSPDDDTPNLIRSGRRIKYVSTLFFLSKDERIVSFRIKEVDTSRPWTIRETNGYEDILYLDAELCDKKLNYYKLK